MIKINCKICGKEITTFYCLRNRKKYCSRECSYLAKKEGGKPCSEETKRKISITNKNNLTGITNGIKTRFKKGVIPWCIGKKLSEEHKRKLSLVKLGKPGHKLTEETKKILSEIHEGENNVMWKGDLAGYSSMHKWVRRNKGKAIKCIFCGKEWNKPKSIHWANKEHNYKRNINDYISLCVYCHRKYDIEHNNIYAC
jgi:hypothetical protein